MQGIIDQLRPGDIFSIVLISDSACAPKRMGPVSCTDIPALKKQASSRWVAAGEACCARHARLGCISLHEDTAA